MNYWRLIVHHNRGLRTVALAMDRQNSFIVLGWGAIGDLRAWRPATGHQIRHAILNIPDYASPTNASNGGTSLWNLYRETRVGDMVILVTDRGRQAVVEVVGEYEWRDDYTGVDTIPDYHHCRRVRWTDQDPEEIWANFRLPPALNPYCALLALVPRSHHSS